MRALAIKLPRRNRREPSSDCEGKKQSGAKRFRMTIRRTRSQRYTSTRLGSFEPRQIEQAPARTQTNAKYSHNGGSNELSQIAPTLRPREPSLEATRFSGRPGYPLRRKNQFPRLSCHANFLLDSRRRTRRRSSRRDS